MLERLKSFLGSLQDKSGDATPGADDPRVAAAALMIHVVEADGLQVATERKRLRQSLVEAYSLSREQLDQLVRAGEAASRESADYAGFTDTLNRHLDADEKAAFIGLLWDVVYADGEMHELEDNVVWRVAEMLDVPQKDRAALRQKAFTAHGGD